jgi:hypothetical protein
MCATLAFVQCSDQRSVFRDQSSEISDQFWVP